MARANRPLGWVALTLALASLMFALVSGGVARSAQAPVDTGLRIEKAWISCVPIAGHPAAGYFTMVGGATTDTLVGADSPAAASIELHSNQIMGGMMHMSTDLSVAVPAHGRVVFGELGRHLMIFGMKPGLKMLPLRLRFASGRTISIDAPVRAIGGLDPSPATSLRAI